jgi:hypothetical protein
LHASWLKVKFSARRHYGNMDAEDAAAPEAQDLQVQQPPAVFAGGNVVDANGQNIMFNVNPALLAVHQPRPSCFSRCCSVCGVILFVSLTAIFSLFAASLGNLLEFSAGHILRNVFMKLCMPYESPQAPAWTVLCTSKATAPPQRFRRNQMASCT